MVFFFFVSNIVLVKCLRCSFGGLACTVFSSIVITRKPQSEHLVFFRSFLAYPISSHHGRSVLSCTSVSPTFSRFVGSFFPVLSAWISPYLIFNNSRAFLLSILAALAVVISLDNQVKDQHNCAFS